MPGPPGGPLLFCDEGGQRWSVAGTSAGSLLCDPGVRVVEGRWAHRRRTAFATVRLRRQRRHPGGRTGSFEWVAAHEGMESVGSVVQKADPFWTLLAEAKKKNVRAPRKEKDTVGVTPFGDSPDLG